MAVAAHAANVPWRPTAAQAELIAALCGPGAAAHQRLEAWLRRQDLRSGQPGDDGLTGLLPFAYGRLLEIDRDAGVTRRAHAVTMANAQVNLLRAGGLFTVLDRFDEAGIPAVVLKGMAFALRCDGQFGRRAMADVDILVRPADVSRAAGLLHELGWAGAGGFSASLLRDLMRVHHARPYSSGPAHSLDLHWRSLAASTYAADQRFWDATATIDVGHRRVRVLDPSDEVFHVCCHAVQPTWAPSPRWMLDVHAVLEALGHEVRWGRIVETAAATRTTGRLRAALAAVEEVMPGLVPSSVGEELRRLNVPPWEGRELRLFERMPPFSDLDRLRWHWYAFRRLREEDSVWRRWPPLAGFLDYLRLKRRLRTQLARPA